MLGKLLDLFMFREIRGAVEQVLGIKVSNGNGGIGPRGSAASAQGLLVPPSWKRGALPGRLFF